MKQKEVMEAMEVQESELISVSEFAKRKNISQQTVYNWIKSGLVECVEFQRGTMKGKLIKTHDKN